MLKLKFDGTDNGNCRVYYRQGKRLFAFQEDRPDEFTLYICSSDGEPSHEYTGQYELEEFPPIEDATSRNFNKWTQVQAGKMGQALLDVLAQL